MSLLRKLAGETAVYGLSSVLGRVLNYLLVPLYTSVFAPAEYGIVTELYAYVAFLNILYVYGLETAYFRFSSSNEGYNYFNLAFTSILFSSVLLSGVLWLFSEGIADSLEYPEKGNLIRWLAAVLAIDAIVAIPFARLRQTGQASKFAVFKLTNIGVNILLNLFFILWCPALVAKSPNGWMASIYNPDLGVGYVFLSNLIANGLYLLFFVPLWLKIRLTFHVEEWKRLMKYAWPVLIIGFAGVTNEMLSRAILKYRLPDSFYSEYNSQEVLGIFGACYKLAVFMTLAVQAFRYAFEPFFFAQAEDKNSPQLFSRVMTGFVMFTCLSWLALSVFLPYYAPIFLRQESYLFALDAVPLLLGGGMLLGIAYNLSLWYKLTDKTIYGAYISVIGAVFTLVLNWTLIPVLGYMGSAYATFVSYLVMTFLSYVWGKRHYPVPYHKFKVLSIISTAGLGIVVNHQLESSFVSSFVIVLIFLTLLIILERKAISRLIAK